MRSCSMTRTISLRRNSVDSSGQITRGKHKSRACEGLARTRPKEGERAPSAREVPRANETIKGPKSRRSARQEKRGIADKRGNSPIGREVEPKREYDPSYRMGLLRRLPQSLPWHSTPTTVRSAPTYGTTGASAHNTLMTRSHVGALRC